MHALHTRIEMVFYVLTCQSGLLTEKKNLISRFGYITITYFYVEIFC